MQIFCLSHDRKSPGKQKDLTVRLSHIGATYGFFYDAHRAIEDCNNGIEVLSRPLPGLIATNLPKTTLLGTKDELLDGLYNRNRVLKSSS